ncbi:S8 family serine peptidase [Rhizorhapis sp. SPR117]|uniref:S8 family serine peptidase n=1 Tax=Rhizorhapis sp. SPR117 TaxID=2912611 RepID=UPI001F2FFA2F|nr:S8 family serine peptidase [Rhizorhapis sp. SPR117]
MRGTLYMTAVLPLLMLSASGSAQLNLPGGIAIPDVTGPVGRATEGLGLPDISRLSPAQVARTLLDARLDRLSGLIRRNPEHLEWDDHRYPAERGVVVATGLSDKDLKQLQAEGFKAAPEDVDGLDMGFVRLQAPAGQSLAKSIRRARAIAPGAQIGSNPIYFQSGNALAGGGALAAGKGSAGRAIGLIDGGVGKHPSLTGPIDQRGFAKGAPAPSGHATAVASLIAGNGTVKGAAPAAPLLVADIYGRDPAGGNAIAIARALGWMAANGVRIVTISLVGPDNPLLSGAVAAARRKGMIVVAAVGNDGPAAPPAFPASYKGVIAVTGVDARDRALIEAGRALHLDYAAPGADMIAASINGESARVRGTSFAAPFVAGRLYRHLQRGNMSAAMQALAGEAQDLGKKGPDKLYGRGLVCGTCRNEP